MSSELFKSRDVYFIYLFLIGVELLYNVVLVSAVQQSESLTERHQSIPFQILTSLQIGRAHV